jgi:hypothetical protein
MSVNQNKTDGVQTSGVVIVADPNVIIAQDEKITNGLLRVEDLRPYVSFTCIRRKEHVIKVQNDGTSITEDDGMIKEVHFLGFNPETKQYTVSYADNLTGVYTEDFVEGLGISDISVTHDSNMMPLVDVTFVDVKGSSLFEKTDKSLYAAIFDYPAPIFTLTMKGAFGMYVEYTLHMTKNDIAFDTTTGNYIVKAKFIGEYFGPLTDVLTGWLRSVPYLKGGVGKDSMYQTKEDTKVNSYFELIYRGSILYKKIEEIKENSPEMKEHANLIAASGDLDTLKKLITNFISGPDVLKGIVDDNSVKITNIEVKSTSLLGDFDVNKKMEVSIFFPIVEDIIPTQEATDAGFIDFNTQTVQKVIKLIKELFVEPLKNYTEFNKDGSVDNRVSIDGGIANIKVKSEGKVDFNNSIPISNLSGQTNHIKIDMTTFIANMLKAEKTLKDTKTAVTNNVSNNFKNLVGNILGIDPRIGNIFKVLLNDFDFFLYKIKSAGEREKSLPSMSSSGGARVLSYAPWPTVVKEKRYAANNKAQEVYIYPATQPEFASWDECKFVEEYCASLLDQHQTMRNVEKIIKQIDSKLYNPISPIEAFTASIASVLSSNEYVGNESVEGFLKTALLRFLFMREFTYKGMFTTTKSTPLVTKGFFVQEVPDDKTRIKLIKSVAKVDAYNGFYGLTNTTTQNEVKNMDFNKLIAYITNTFTKTETLPHGNTSSVFERYLITGKISKFDKDSRDKTTNFISFRGSIYTSRGHENFSGIKEITSKDNQIHGKLTEVKGENYGEEPDSEANNQRMNVLKEHSMNQAWYVFGKTDNEKEKPELTNANTLLFPDVDSSVDGKSDFLKSENLHSIFLSPFRDFKEILSGEKKKVISVWKNVDVDEYKKQVLEKLMTMIHLPYNGEGYNKVVFEKFIQPATIEIPVIALAAIAKYQKDNNVLSKKDGEKFEPFLDMFLTGVASIHAALVKNKMEFLDKIDFQFKEENFKNEIGRYDIYKGFFEKYYIINNSTVTFFRKENVTDSKIYPLMDNEGKDVNEIVIDKEIDTTFKTYFTDYFKVLKELIEANQKTERDEDREFKSKISDPDFKANLYYNFKAIYDRWLAGNSRWLEPPVTLQGDELVGNEESTYNKFSFITRSHQDISDVSVVDFQNLIDDAKDGEISVFSSIGKLLQENNYNFFPLNSYIDLTKAKDDIGGRIGAWKKSFQPNISMNEDTLARPKFVCMYVGGYSAMAGNPQNSTGEEYPQDSVRLDIDVNKPTDFLDSNDDKQQVFAFKVRVGSQNQTLFTNFGLSTEEFTMSDESIKMHSAIMDKQSETSPIRKSQNLLNVYSQRSYTCSLAMPLGNMCIQPTQYFDLEGMNIFGGAYMIFNVQHTISSDSQHIETRFKGWRISHYVHPVIDDFVLSYLGLDNEIAESEDAYKNQTGTVGATPDNNGNSDKVIPNFGLINDVKDVKDDAYIELYKVSNSIHKNRQLRFENWVSDSERAEFVLKVKAMCYEVGGDALNPDWMMMVMLKESEIKPQAVNGETSATGLIQIIPSTAGDITKTYNRLYRKGTNKGDVGKITVGMIAGLGRVQQLNIVRAYLHRVLERKDIDKLDSYWILNLSIFRPASVPYYNDNNRVMFKKGEIAYEKNINFDPSRIGHVTIGMYKAAIKKGLISHGMPQDLVDNLS